VLWQNWVRVTAGVKKKKTYRNAANYRDLLEEKKKRKKNKKK